tara:strand:+ start:161 stop:484 length:324 start_codon:yes stop_codon:yes gene_type:complete
MFMRMMGSSVGTFVRIPHWMVYLVIPLTSGIYKMKIFLFLAASILAAMSFGDDVVKVHRLTVEESLAAIEVINVTAEKVLDESTLVDVDKVVKAVLEDAKEAIVQDD